MGMSKSNGSLSETVSEIHSLLERFKKEVIFDEITELSLSDFHPTSHNVIILLLKIKEAIYISYSDFKRIFELFKTSKKVDISYKELNLNIYNTTELEKDNKIRNLRCLKIEEAQKEILKLKINKNKKEERKDRIEIDNPLTLGMLNSSEISSMEMKRLNKEKDSKNLESSIEFKNDRENNHSGNLEYEVGNKQIYRDYERPEHYNENYRLPEYQKYEYSSNLDDYSTDRNSYYTSNDFLVYDNYYPDKRIEYYKEGLYRNPESSFFKEHTQDYLSSFRAIYKKPFKSSNEVFRIEKRKRKYHKKNNPSSVTRPYKCEYSGCKSAFKRFEHLKRHNKIHTGERPFICKFPGCSKKFARSDNMNQHMKLHKQVLENNKIYKRYEFE